MLSVSATRLIITAEAARVQLIIRSGTEGTIMTLTLGYITYVAVITIPRFAGGLMQTTEYQELVEIF